MMFSFHILVIIYFVVCFLTLFCFSDLCDLAAVTSAHSILGTVTFVIAVSRRLSVTVGHTSLTVLTLV